ncbi:hypothetical protein QZH41_006095 [Actinostola sp. cb2023]|nr:hypothetical protein QZH41_006095 [Actinostola sp. cb2023]
MEWYVLLKERNMLNTLMHEAKRQGVPMPSPERYHKVKKSMAAIKLVLGEREIALKDLESQVWMFDKQADEEKNKELLSFALKSSNETTEQHSAPEAFVVNMNDDILKEQSKSPSEEEKPVLSPNLRPT